MSVILLGNFNAHYNFANTTMPNTDVGLKLFHFLECNNLAQFVKKTSTRITESVESILDLIISDSPGLSVSTGSLSPPSNCDHNIVLGKLSISKPKQDVMLEQCGILAILM